MQEASLLGNVMKWAVLSSISLLLQSLTVVQWQWLLTTHQKGFAIFLQMSAVPMGSARAKQGENSLASAIKALLAPTAMKVRTYNAYLFGSDLKFAIRK